MEPNPTPNPYRAPTSVSALCMCNAFVAPSLFSRNNCRFSRRFAILLSRALPPFRSYVYTLLLVPIHCIGLSSSQVSPQHVNLSRRGRFLRTFAFLSPFCSLRVSPLSCLRVVFDFLRNIMYLDLRSWSDRRDDFGFHVCPTCVLNFCRWGQVRAVAERPVNTTSVIGGNYGDVWLVSKCRSLTWNVYFWREN